MEGTEEYWREHDRRYARLAGAERIRYGTVTAAASPFSYSITLPGETIARTGVPRVSSVAPVIGDKVRVSMANDEPEILDVVGRGRLRVSTDTLPSATTSSATYIVSGAGTDALTLNLVAGQVVQVTVTARLSHSAGAGHGAVMSFRVTGSTTYGPIDDDSIESDSAEGSTCSRTTLFTATATGSHTVTLMYKAINGATAVFVTRRLMVVE